MNRERLEIQIDILRRINPEKFDMDAWIYRIDLDEPCGTTCCAFGYAALDERLRAQGLGMKITFRDNSAVEVANIEDFNRVSKVGYRNAQPTFEDWVDFEAAAMFYDIDYAQACDLFDPNEYCGDEFSEGIRPEHVIDRIQDLLATE